MKGKWMRRTGFIVVCFVFFAFMFILCFRVTRGKYYTMDEYSHIISSLSADYELKDYELVDLMELSDSWILLRYDMTDVVSEGINVTKLDSKSNDYMRLFVYNTQEGSVFEIPHQCP